MPNALTVWLLTDNKPGHRNQLRGLALHLEAMAGARCHWIEVAAYPVSLWQLLCGHKPPISLAPPDMVIAAGSGTHRLLLACRRTYRCMAVALMKPGFPLRWIDAAIIPEHDNPALHSQVFISQGALNAVRPATQPTTQPTTPKTGLMLIGGLSKHYRWDSAAILEQITTLCHEQADWRWTLTDSRRTPTDFTQSLQQSLQNRCPANLTYTRHQDTAPDWLPAQLAHTSQVWVTPDSVSMVYESLSAGQPTGLFDLPCLREGRIARGIRRLLETKKLTGFDTRQQLDANHRPEPLQEAQRAARWLIERWQKQQKPDKFP